MQDNLLISHTDLKTIKGNFSANIESDQVDPYIREAQTGELRRFLGDELYLIILLDNPLSVQRLIDLMQGVDYTNRQGKQVRFNGLEECLKYWSYYRYLRDSDLLAMRYGNRIAEDSIYSTSAFREQVKRSIYNAKSLALKFQYDAERYLRTFPDVYPEWSNKRRTPKKRSFEFEKLPNGKERYY